MTINNDNDNNNNIILFERPEQEFSYIVRADPNRKEYNKRVPKRPKPFNGAFAVKKKLDKLKAMCDSAFLLTLTVKWGKSVNYSIFRPEVKDGYAEIIFENATNYLMASDSPTAFDNFRFLFLEADRMEIIRKSFSETSVRLYVNDIWVDMDTSLSMERDELLLPNEVKDYWQSIRDNHLEEFKTTKAAVKAATESYKYTEFLMDYMFSHQSDTDNNSQKNLIDNSMLPKVLADFSISRDAILNLHYNYGIGTSVEIENITSESANSLISFAIQMKIIGAAFFDTGRKMQLLKRCLENCCGITMNTKNETGEITLVLDIKNKYTYPDEE